jgi:hypothetical protein
MVVKFNEYFSEKSYQKFGFISDFDLDMSSDRVCFSDSEKNFILSSLPDLILSRTNIDFPDYKVLVFNSNINGCRDCINIAKYEDEWYTVKILDRPGRKSVFFKCDQLDGVIDCVKDNL